MVANRPASTISALGRIIHGAKRLMNTESQIYRQQLYDFFCRLLLYRDATAYRRNI